MNKDLIKLTIMNPLGSTVINAKWIEVNTDTGSFIVQSGRAPIVVVLSAGKDLIIGLDDGSEKEIKVSGGILEVNRNYANVLLTNE